MTDLTQYTLDLCCLWPDAVQAGYGSRAHALIKDNMLYLEFFEDPPVFTRSDLQAHGFVPQKSISPLVWANTLSYPAVFYAGHIAW